MLENLSALEPLMVLKHFGPGIPDLVIGHVQPD